MNEINILKTISLKICRFFENIYSLIFKVPVYEKFFDECEKFHSN